MDDTPAATYTTGDAIYELGQVRSLIEDRVDRKAVELLDQVIGHLAATPQDADESFDAWANDYWTAYFASRGRVIRTSDSPQAQADLEASRLADSDHNRARANRSRIARLLHR